MDCKYFGECGACRVYEDGYEAQFAQKLQINKERFAPFFKGEISSFKSPTAHYRSRSEFKIWHNDDGMHYAMNHQDKKGVVLIDECPQVSEHIAVVMPKLLEALKNHNLGFKLFGADFLTAQSGEIVITLLYHRALDEEWKSHATEISEELGVHIIGRSRKQKVVISQDYVTETLNVAQREYRFEYIENSFTQPNSAVNEKMIGWALEMLGSSSGDLLELYCGAGNFTIPFASLFDKVLATEISKSSINAAKRNMLLNSVSNIEFVRMDVVDFVDALDGKREYRRLKDIDVGAYNINTIFVDPPRSGMDENSANFAARYEQILYISCNPETLYRDLNILTKTHNVLAMALFDQFPYTHHAEMGVKLIKKGLDS